MTTDRTDTCDRDHRLGAVLAACLEAMDDGRTPNRADLLARHPEFGVELVQFLDDQERVERCARPLRAALGGVTESAFAAQSRLGDFRIVREVGRGGMGVVYEAEQVSLRRRVALKVLPFAATMDPRALQRFQNEAWAAACLHHTNVVPVYYVGCERGIHFYAMQFIDGQTLADFIGELRRSAGQEPAPTPGERTTAHTPADAAAVKADTVPGRQSAPTTKDAARSREFFRRAAEWGVQAAEALDHAHQAAVVHRDVKPGNLLLDESGRLWVADFGLAHVRQGEAGLTITGEMLGTLRYMSPEQALAKRAPIDHRTDVYSLGATLYELLTLRPAFEGKDRQELLRQIAFDEPKPPRRLDRKIPAELEVIVLKAMEKNTAERYATAQEMADDLQRWLDDRPIQARRPSWARVAVKWARRHKPLLGATAAVLLMAMLLGGGAAWVARDKAMKRAETARVVGQALDESASWQLKRRLPEAQSAARRAAGLVAGGEAGDALRERVRARSADLELLASLENARLESSAVYKEDHFDYEREDNLYAAAFRAYGLDMEVLPPAEVGERLRRSTVAPEVAAMLDHWAMIRRKTGGPMDGSWTPILEAARAADLDAWRNGVRDALERGDNPALENMARSDEVFGLLPTTLDVLADALKTGGAPERAVTLLAEAQARTPDDFWLNLDLGGALLQSKKWDEALGYFRSALATRPSSAAIHSNLGITLFHKNHPDEAIREYHRAIELDPKFAVAYNNLGFTLRATGRLDEAIREFRRAIELEPNSAEFHFNLGLTLRHKAKPDEAIREYRRAIELDPNDFKTHNNLGGLLREKGQPDEAIREFRRAVELDPNNAEIHNNLGEALGDNAKPDEAIREYRRAIELDPNDAKIHYNLGVTLCDKGQPDEAVLEYRRAIELSPELAEPHNNLGNVLLHQHQPDEAIREYRRAIELDPNKAEFHHNLGDALRDKAKPDEAIREYRRTIELDPGLAQPHNNLGNALRDKARPDEAIREYRRAIELNPNNAGFHYNLAGVLCDKAKPDEAIQEFRRAIALDPKVARLHGALGETLLWQGRFAEARDASQRCLDLLPPGDALRAHAVQQLQQCKHFLVLNQKLAAILEDNEKPADAAERLALALLCQQPFKKRYAAATRFYVEAFAAEPALAEKLGAEGGRYDAACAAALAASGQGKDAASPDDKERAHLRAQALEWLRADLKAWRRLLATGPDRNRPAIAQQLQHWLEDSDLAGIRGEKALLALPEGERPDWQKLWQDVEALRQQAASPPDKATPSAPKQIPSD